MREDGAVLLALIFGFVVGAAIATAIATPLTIDWCREKAIAAHAAHWEINPVTGDSKFVYGVAAVNH